MTGLKSARGVLTARIILVGQLRGLHQVLTSMLTLWSMFEDAYERADFRKAVNTVQAILQARKVNLTPTSSEPANRCGW